MKQFTKAFIFGLISILFISCTSDTPKDARGLYTEIDMKAAPNTLTPEEEVDGWKLLFDGETSEGWHGYNMAGFPECWAIEDGTLTMNSEGMGEDQDIITNKVYRNFALSLEYKLTKMANSGVIYQVKEDTVYKYPYETGPEFQVIDDQNWPDPLEEWQSNGANYAMYPAKISKPKEIGEWNHLFLVVKDNHVTHILNGEVIVEFDKYSEEWKKLKDSGKWVDFPDWGKFDEGNISLQNHGTKVWYRSVKLKEL